MRRSGHRAAAPVHPRSPRDRHLRHPRRSRATKPASRRGDRIFAGLARAAGVTILLALAAVFIFLAVEGWNGLNAAEATLPAGHDFLGYIGPLVLSTILAAAIALIVAVPFAIGIALFISHYAPRRIAAPLAYVVDLLAAVPSVVFGLWGGRYLAGYLQPAHVWLAEHLGFLPFFGAAARPTGARCSPPAIVLAIMILPIMTAISREVFAQTPRLHEEAALALGATRWEMIRYAVFPYARSGMVSGVMLGLGRALGETMAVAMVLAVSPVATLNVIGVGGPATIASNIALNYKEATPEPAVAADRHRPGAVRRHVPGQLRGPLDRRPQRAEAGRRCMSDRSTHRPATPRAAPRGRRRLVGVMALAAAGLPAMLLGWGLVAWVVVAARALPGRAARLVARGREPPRAPSTG